MNISNTIACITRFLISITDKITNSSERKSVIQAEAEIEKTKINAYSKTLIATIIGASLTVMTSIVSNIFKK